MKKIMVYMTAKTTKCSQGQTRLKMGTQSRGSKAHIVLYPGLDYLYNPILLIKLTNEKRHFTEEFKLDTISALIYNEP